VLNKPKLTLRKPTPADPIKIALSLQMGFRYVDRNGRYIAQALVTIVDADHPDHTWVDVPLVPETYGEAKA
jgi:hypothetical protein